MGWEAHDQLIQSRRGSSWGEPETRCSIPCRRRRPGGGAGRHVLVLLSHRIGRSLEEIHEALTERVSAGGAPSFTTDRRRSVDSAAVMVEVEARRRRLERSLYRALALGPGALQRTGRHSARRHSGRRAELQTDAGLADDLVVRYQPIVDLSRREIHGFEALAAAPDTNIFDSRRRPSSPLPSRVTASSTSSGCVATQALNQGQMLINGGRGGTAPRDGAKLFLNCSVHAFKDPRLVERFGGRRVSPWGWRPTSMVLEVTERVAVTEWQEFRRILDKVRRSGSAWWQSTTSEPATPLCGRWAKSSPTI